MTIALQEQQLGQLRPANTTAASIYSPAAEVTWIGKSVVICNTSSATALARIFHHEAGTTYDETTAIYWDVEVLADETRTLTVLIAGKTSAGNVAVRTNIANALTFSFYGVEITDV